MPFLWVALGIMALGLVVLFAVGNDGSVLGLSSSSFARLIYLGALLTVIGSVLIRGRPRGNLLGPATIWIAIILVLVLAYQYRHLLGFSG
ncbi:MAG TPA: hypothetical protein VNS02_13035 [Rhizobiaceae bacterium]|nr:hypothetical protein [Rhizobiaceae bacterium]